MPLPGLRDATPGDRPALLDLWVLAWHGAMPEIDFEARRPWLDAHLDALLASGTRLLVADLERHGISRDRPRGSDPPTPLSISGWSGSIGGKGAPGGAPAGFVTVDPARQRLDQLAVHPAHRGSGVADRLVGGAKALSPWGLTLDVNVGNARARRFYARHGFAEVSAGTNPRSGLPTLLLRWEGPSTPFATEVEA